MIFLYVAQPHPANPLVTGLVLILMACVAAGCYVLACWLWPYANCPGCKGTGRRKSPTGKRWGNCRHCQGAGRRLRRGRRAWDYLHNRRERSPK